MLDALFKHATDGIVVVKKSGVIVRLNPKAKELFGYDDQDLIGKQIEKLIPQCFAGNHELHREQYMEAPQTWEMGHFKDLYAKRSDGSEFPVEVNLSPFQTSDGEFVVGFITDITEREKQQSRIQKASLEIQELNIRLEERVEQRTQELATAVKKLEKAQEEVVSALKKEKELNNMKSEFVNIASHEFRTPLATILSSASLIARYCTSEDDEKRQKHVTRIKSAITNLTEILNDFLSIGKLEEGHIHSIPVLVELEAFCVRLVEEVQGTCKEGQQIHFQYEGLSDAWLDKQLLRNILFNLLSNSIKYSPADKPVFLKILTQTDQIVIEVTDQGIGIPLKDQANIFDRFFRAENAGTVQGTGLGLNIVSSYVALMGGSISFTSEPEQGTTFYVNLPNSMHVYDLSERVPN
jgi:PAS domain S-box-containing protein